jgi:hypothetical protein
MGARVKLGRRRSCVHQACPPPESRAAAACGAPRAGAGIRLRARGRVDLAAACIGRSARIAPRLSRALVAPLRAAVAGARDRHLFFTSIFRCRERSGRPRLGIENFARAGCRRGRLRRAPVIHLYFQATRSWSAPRK